MARPTIFSKKLADLICTRIADGETLRAICRDDDEMPARSTVSQWIATNEKFADQVARAREAASHVLIEEAREVADDGSNDFMERHFRDHTAWVVNGEAIQRSRLRVDVRWREAEQILPKVYGRKQQIEHSGGLSVALVNVTDEELVAEIVQLVTTGRVQLPPGVELFEDDDEEQPPQEDDDDYRDIA